MKGISLMERSSLLTLIAVAISIAGIGLLFATYSSLRSDLNATEKGLTEQSQKLRADVNTLANDTTTQLADHQQKIKDLNLENANLRANVTLLEDRVKALEERVRSLEIRTSNQVIWYGAREPDQAASGGFGRLESVGLDPEYRDRPVSNLGNAALVIIDWPDPWDDYSVDEIDQMKDYVRNGGRLILATSNDYSVCNPPSTCAMEVARNFGFAFNGNIKYDSVIVPAEGQSLHPIWTTPHDISSFSHWCCDAYISKILDPSNVKVLARVQGNATSITNYGEFLVTNPVAIVVNEDPSFNGGKVMGTGRDMFIGTDNTGATDSTMFDNIVRFMLS